MKCYTHTEAEAVAGSSPPSSSAATDSCLSFFAIAPVFALTGIVLGQGEKWWNGVYTVACAVVFVFLGVRMRRMARRKSDQRAG